jgi:hypothetical protein
MGNIVNYWRRPLVGDTVMEIYATGQTHWVRSRGNVTTYTIPEPRHYLRYIILATAIGTLGAAVLSYLGF